MAKYQDSSALLLEDLPNEILLKIFSYLDISDIIHCGQMSKRFRKISHDELLWQKVNLSHRTVTSEFLKFILDNVGCKYLSLHFATLTGNLSLNKPSQLRYLDLAQDLSSSPTKRSTANNQVYEELISSTYSLQKLSFFNKSRKERLWVSCPGWPLSPTVITRFSYQNGKSLNELYLAEVELSFESLKTIIDKSLL